MAGATRNAVRTAGVHSQPPKVRAPSRAASPDPAPAAASVGVGHLWSLAVLHRDIVNVTEGVVSEARPPAHPQAAVACPKVGPGRHSASGASSRPSSVGWPPSCSPQPSLLNRPRALRSRRPPDRGRQVNRRSGLWNREGCPPFFSPHTGGPDQPFVRSGYRLAIQSKGTG